MKGNTWPDAYARPATREGGEARGTVLSPHLIVLRMERDEGLYRRLDLACSLQITSRWREAVLTDSNDLSSSVRSALSGHDAEGAPLEDPHLAFLPLGFVSHNHADGHLLGMAVALPRDLSATDRRAVVRALGRVRQLNLGRLGVWRLETVAESRPPWALHPEGWTAHPSGATDWSTVTPVAFDRHPKAKGRAAYRDEVAAMLRRCCSRVGLPEPRVIVASPVSSHAGVPPAHAFPRLERKDGSLRRHTHCILVFESPVCGPMVLGAGRYRGYGFCRPLDGSRSVKGDS